MVMATPTLQNAHLSEVNPEFAPLIPSINEAFETIWTYNDMKEFRGNWTKRPANYPAYVPDQGFKTTFQQVPMSDGTEVEVRILKPEIAVGVSLPLLFVLHGGGEDEAVPIRLATSLTFSQVGWLAPMTARTDCPDQCV